MLAFFRVTAIALGCCSRKCGRGKASFCPCEDVLNSSARDRQGQVQLSRQVTLILCSCARIPVALHTAGFPA